MLSEASKFKDEDRKNEQRIQVRDEFKQYVFQLQDTLNDPGLNLRLGTDADTISEALLEAMAWLDINETAEASTITSQRRQLEKKVTPIMGKLYSGKKK